MVIGYFAPSYRRPIKSTTQIAFPFVKIVVKESEADEYRKNGNDIIVAPDSAQGNLCRIRNWIIDTQFEGVDALVLLDDDYKKVSVWRGHKEFDLSADEFNRLCVNQAILAHDNGSFLFGINCTNEKIAYMDYQPYSTNIYIGGPFQGHIKGTSIRYDESLNLKEDYDITLQHLHKYGCVWRCNFAHYYVKQAIQAGGCAEQRNSLEEKRQFELLQKKWGSKVITRDSSSKRSFDFNPILRSPLKGV